MRVHQVLSGAGPVDGVTAQARAWRERFAAWGWEGEDHAAAISPGADGFAPLGRLDPGPGDVLLLHYSAYAARLRPLLSRPNPIVLVSHNVTPARWLWDVDALTAVRCEVGRRQLGAFARRADVAVGVSEYNARELEAAGAAETEVVPILLDPARLGAPGPEWPAGAGAPEVLFVGRLAPHKRQDAVIRAVALLRRLGAPGARLTLVGEPVNEAFADRLRALAEALAPGAVTFRSGLSDAELAGAYRDADAFLCLSEHEGFCIPLLEAFHFGVPVVARAAGAVPETAQDAAVLLEEEDDEAVAAAALAEVLGDEALRAELRARGRRRLAAYAPERTEAAMRAAVERAGERR